MENVETYFIDGVFGLLDATVHHEGHEVSIPHSIIHHSYDIMCVWHTYKSPCIIIGQTAGFLKDFAGQITGWWFGTCFIFP